MSNPGVIRLASLNDKSLVKFPKRFEIEDNIGEAIHIHYQDIRIDLTIKEFMKLAEETERIYSELADIPGFDISEYGREFLMCSSSEMKKIAGIEKDHVMLSDIKVDIVGRDGRDTYASLKESRVYKALNGIGREDDRRKQINFFGNRTGAVSSNKERTGFILSEIKEKGYPFDNKYIVLGPDNVIMDGQHRAAALYYLYGDREVEIRRVILREQTESVCPYREQEYRAGGIAHKIKDLVRRMLGQKAVMDRLELISSYTEMIQRDVETLKNRDR